jgi:hypothetical protein
VPTCVLRNPTAEHDSATVPGISRHPVWMDRRSWGSGLEGPAESVDLQAGWDER